MASDRYGGGGGGSKKNFLKKMIDINMLWDKVQKLEDKNRDLMKKYNSLRKEYNRLVDYLKLMNKDFNVKEIIIKNKKVKGKIKKKCKTCNRFLKIYKLLDNFVGVCVYCNERTVIKDDNDDEEDAVIKANKKDPKDNG